MRVINFLISSAFALAFPAPELDNENAVTIPDAAVPVKVIELEFNRNYTREEIDHLRATATVDALNVTLPPTQAGALAKRAQVTTLSVTGNFECPTLGLVTRTMKARIRVLTTSRLGQGNTAWERIDSSIDAFEFGDRVHYDKNGVRLVHNEPYHRFCLNAGHINCGYEIRSTFLLGIASTMQIITVDALPPTMIETCTFITTNGICPAMSVAPTQNCHLNTWSEGT